MTVIFNKRSELQKRRDLRQRMPPAERIVWKHLQNRHLSGAKFRRQVSVGVYVLDFYCPAFKLALEIDGSSHNGEDAHEYDEIRQKSLEAVGVRFLRFTNAQVYQNIEGVMTAIEAYILAT